MRRVYPLLILCLCAASPLLAQQRPRYSFDNFDTSRGVNVVRPDFVPVGAKARTVATNAVNPKQKNGKKPLVNPTVLSQPVNQPSRQTTSRMNVNEGFADQELNRMASYNKASYSGNASGSMKGFTTGSPAIDSYIVESSRKYSIDPLLIYSQMHTESSFKLNATSNKGASGLMQLMPATARRLGVTNIYDPKQNIEGGIKYMRMLLDMFGGDVNLALAGYNAGEGAVMKYGNQIPPFNETQEYVRRISARYASISDGSFARNYRRVNPSTAAKLEQKEARPLTAYDPGPVAVRLADGRMRLVNQ